MAIVIAAAMAGCGTAGKRQGQSDTAAGSSSQTKEATGKGSEISDALETPDQKGDWVIGFSNYTLGNSWKQQMEAEFQEAADALVDKGVIDSYVMLNANDDQSKQIADIRDLIMMDVNAICVTAITQDALNDVLEEAEEAGIVVINFDNTTTTEKISSKISCSDYELGVICGEWMGEKLGEAGGKVVVLDGIAGSSTSENRHKGMLEALERTCPKAEVLTTAACDFDYATAKTAMEDIVAAYPEIDGVLSQGGSMTQAAMEVFLANDRELVPMTGEASNGFLRAWAAQIDNGFESMAFVAPSYMSVKALNVAVNALNGADVEKEYTVSEEPVTNDTIEKYYRPDLSDSFWVFSTLSEEKKTELFGE